MLEKFNDLSGTILDPTCGAGGLLAAAIIAGADPTKCYGIELDRNVALLARDRLSKLGVPRANIKIGDALDPSAYEFDGSENDIECDTSKYDIRPMKSKGKKNHK